jgi:hypothetical protein
VTLLLALLAGAGPARAGLYWSAPIQIANSKLTGLSCPSSSLCVGTDYAGDVLVSVDPLLGSTAWSSTKLAGSLELSDVSCAPQGAVCAAVGGAGIFVSTDPAGGPGAWQHVAGSTAASSVSCPSTALCVAARANAVFSSTDPGNPASSWNEEYLGSGPDPMWIRGISCPDTSLCVAVDSEPEGGLITSTSPAGGPASWTKAQIGPGHLTSVSCPTGGFCVALGEETLASSANPRGGSSTWQLTHPVLALKQVSQLACASASVCAAIGQNGYVASSSAPAAAASWESVEGVDGTNALTAISCPSETTCFAADEALVTGLAAHHLNVATEGSGEGSVRSGPLPCPFGCTYSGPVCPRNCGGDSRYANAFIPQRLTEIVCGDGEFGDGTKWSLPFCSMLYPQQDAPELTPTARPGSVFAGWSGDCAGRGPCAPGMGADRSVAATFEPKLALHGVTQRRSRWRERGGHAHLPVGTAFTFTLNRRATVTLSFTRLARGARSRHGCRPLPRHHKHVHRCTRHLSAGTLHLTEPAGTDTIPFPGAISVAGGGHVNLHPGSYTTKLAASGEGESTPATQLAFTIVK